MKILDKVFEKLLGHMASLQCDSEHLYENPVTRLTSAQF